MILFFLDLGSGYTGVFSLLKKKNHRVVYVGSLQVPYVGYT